LNLCYLNILINFQIFARNETKEINFLEVGICSGVHLFRRYCRCKWL